MLEMNGKLGKIGILTGQNHLVHGTHVGWHDNGFDRGFQSFRYGLQDLSFADAEGLSDSLSATHHITDEFGTFGPNVLEIDHLFVAVEMSRNVAQFDAVFVELHFAVSDEILNEPTEPKAVKVDVLRRCPSLRGNTHFVGHI
jgi:hypothetical protein